ncbi:MAG TPA: 4'-phosphopantetheinyl transferase superfamily protein [Pyrinomonadaceae bacterium]|jgi:4'-phosphopantetheinyl transferase
MSPLNPPWPPAPKNPRLEEDDVHVWLVGLKQAARDAQSVLGLLSEDERERARRFHFDHHRARFILAHAAQRLILSHYLRLSPAQLRFRFNPYGKPALDLPAGDDALQFNLSHSGELALLAIGRGRAVGVDIEHIRAEFAHEQIAERFFSQREVSMLRALPENLRPQAFFNCWTRKEAYIKALGEGLSLALDGFDVSLIPGEQAALLSVRDNPGEVARWSLRELAPGEGYAAAMAVEGQDWRLSCWRWAREDTRAET